MDRALEKLLRDIATTNPIGAEQLASAIMAVGAQGDLMLRHASALADLAQKVITENAGLSVTVAMLEQRVAVLEKQRWPTA